MADKNDPLFGKFLGEKDDALEPISKGLIQQNALAAPSDELKQQIAAARAASPASGESADAAPQAAESPAPEADGGDPLAGLMGDDAPASGDAEAPAPAQPAVGEVGQSQRIKAVSSGEESAQSEAEGAIDALLSGGSESGLLSAVAEAPQLPQTLSGRLGAAPTRAPAAEAADADDDDALLAKMMGGDDADADSGADPLAAMMGDDAPADEPASAPAEESDPLASMMGDDAPAPAAESASAQEEGDPLAAMMGDDAPSASEDEGDPLAAMMGDDAPSASEDEGDPLAAMMGDDAPSASEEEGDPLAAMMGDDAPSASEDEGDPLAAMMGDDAPAASEAPAASSATDEPGGIDDLFGADDDAPAAPQPAAAPAASTEELLAVGESQATGKSKVDAPILSGARATKKVKPDPPPGKLYLQLEKLGPDEMPLAVDEFLTDLESEFKNTDTKIPSDLQEQLDKRQEREAFPELEDTRVIGKSGKRVQEAAERAAPGVSSIEELIGGGAPAANVEPEPADEPLGVDALFSDEPAEEAPAPVAAQAEEESSDDPFASMMEDSSDDSDSKDDSSVASEEMVESWLGEEPDIPDPQVAEDPLSTAGEPVDELVNAGPKPSDVADDGVVDISRDGATRRIDADGVSSDDKEAHTIMLSKEEIADLEKSKPVVYEAKLYEVIFGMLGFVLLLSGAAIYGWFYFYTGTY